MSKPKIISRKRLKPTAKPKKRKWLKRLSLSFVLAAVPTNIEWQMDFDDIPNPITVIDEYYHKYRDAIPDKKTEVKPAPISIPAPIPTGEEIIQNGNWTHALRGDLAEIAPLNTNPYPSKISPWRSAQIRFLTISYKIMTGETHYKATIDEWHKHLDTLKSLPKKDQIDAVNLYYNDLIKYNRDNKTYQTKEYYAAPQETLYNKAGDCEDYAILKYYSLKYLGFEDKDLSIAVVDLMTNSTDLETAEKQSVHAVLLVDTLDGIYMLNNNGKKLPELISDNGKYQIMYSFNETSFSKYSLYKREDRIADRKHAQGIKQADNKPPKPTVVL